MQLIVVETFFIAGFLAFVRVGAFLMFAPVFTFVRLPVQIRLIISIVLAVFLLMVSDVTVVNQGSSELVLGVLNEVINGGAMAFGMLAAFAIFHFSGRILDFQMGFGIAGMIDPATQMQAPLTGTLLNMLAIIIFILSGGLSFLFKALVLSFETVPPGQIISLASVEAFLMHFGLIFSLSLALVAPVLLSIFLLDILMAFAGRTMPQMNVFIISIPFKIAIGLTVLAVTVISIQPLLRKIFDAVFHFWGVLLNG